VTEPVDWNVKVGVIVLVRGGTQAEAVEAACKLVNQYLGVGQLDADVELSDAFEGEPLGDAIDIDLTDL
jgi:hypothetical protein